MTPAKRPAHVSGVSEKILSIPTSAGPVLVCGLPGSGYVGKLAADHLVETLEAKKVAEFTCDSFPPQVNVSEAGIAEPLKGQVFFAGKKGHGMLVFTADAQPTTSDGEYELADAVIEYAKKCGVKTVFTLAAYITGTFTSEPKVYGAATSRTMLDAMSEKGAILMKDGGISGMNGLMIGIASIRGLEGGCLLGETSGYLVDAGASKSVLELLARLVDLDIDTSKLKQKAEETRKVISQLQSMSEQSRDVAQQPRRETKPGYIA